MRREGHRLPVHTASTYARFPSVVGLPTAASRPEVARSPPLDANGDGWGDGCDLGQVTSPKESMQASAQ
jgi:hypothetical protein